MHVAYLINQYPKTSHSFIRREIAALEAQGVEVERFSIRRTQEQLVDPQDKAELEKTRAILDAGAAGIVLATVLAIVRSPLKLCKAASLAVRMGWKSDRGVLRHLVYVAEAAVLFRWLKKAETDHLHAHFGTNSAAVAMFCRMLSGPSCSFTAHGSADIDRAEIVSLPEKVAKAAFVIAVSHHGKSQVYRHCSQKHWDKVHVVHCGIDDVFLQAEAAPIPEEPVFSCVGRLTPVKGQLILLQAIHRLVKQGKKPVVYLVGDGPLRSALEEAISELGLADNVHITGWASGEEVRQYIQQSRALVLPSFTEGLPVVIMEALALYRPVISTYVAGIPELVEPGTSGWMVPAGSVDDLVEAMSQASSCSREELEAMGKAGAERVKLQHSVFDEAAKLAQLFERYAGGNEKATAPAFDKELAVEGPYA